MESLKIQSLSQVRPGRPFVCPCMRGGNWFYNPGKFNFYIKDQQATMHFKSQKFNVRVDNTIAVIELQQVFLNESEQPVEATYQFPLDPDMVVSKLIIEMNDKIIEGKVVEKEKAQEKYDDAIASGNAAVMVEEVEKDKDLCKMTIGGIQPAQEVTVRIQFIRQLEIEAGAYCLRIPTSYFIKYGQGAVNPNQNILSGEQKPKSEYSFNIEINTQNPITYLSVPNHSNVIKKEEKTPTQVIIQKQSGDASLLKKDLLVYFQTKKMDSPVMIAQPHPTDEDLIACAISLVPTFTPPQPQEEIEIVENERPEEQDVLPTLEGDPQNKAFIFLVDRSGSMQGKKMEMTNQALKLFIQSLPPGCLFEIISFGTKFTSSSKGKKGYINNDDNLKKVKIEISQYLANMGGTEIYSPLRYAIKSFLVGPLYDGKIEKKIFLLTDGEVSSPDDVINLAKANCNKAQVHTFGIGNGCSKYLVREVAKAGRGSYSFVEEDENLKGKVISALKKAVEPSLKNCSFIYQASAQLASPQFGNIGEAFRNEIVNCYMILNKLAFKDFNFLFNVEYDPLTKGSSSQQYTSHQFDFIEPGETVFKLAAKNKIQDLQDSSQDGDKNSEIEKISIKYGILSSLTAFIGVLKQDDKTTGEIKNVVIPTVIAGKERQNTIIYAQKGPLKSAFPTIAKNITRTGAAPQIMSKLKTASTSSMSNLSSAPILKNALKSQLRSEKESVQKSVPVDTSASNRSKRSSAIPEKEQNKKKTEKKEIQQIKHEAEMDEQYEVDFDEEEKQQTSSTSKVQDRVFEVFNLENLINNQSSIGFWSKPDIIQKYVAQNIQDEDLRSEILQAITDKSKIEEAWLTILALWILKEKYEDQEEEWQMIAKKAKGFLKQLGITRVEPIIKKISFSVK